MQFVVLDFLAKEAAWIGRKIQAESDEKPGHACYATKQARMWRSMAEQAGARFERLYTDLTR